VRCVRTCVCVLYCIVLYCIVCLLLHERFCKNDNLTHTLTHNIHNLLLLLLLLLLLHNKLHYDDDDLLFPPDFNGNVLEKTDATRWSFINANTSHVDSNRHLHVVV
jgi:hypothetical protein